MNWRKLILGGLLLPLRLYFQWGAFVDEIAAFAPESNRHFTRMPSERSSPAFSRAAFFHSGQMILALLWAPSVALVSAQLGFRVSWAFVTTGVMFGVVGVVQAITFGSSAENIAYGVLTGVGLGVLFSFFDDLTKAFGESVTGSFTNGIASGIATGVMLGVVLSVLVRTWGIRTFVEGGITRGFAMLSSFVITMSALIAVARSVTFGVAFIASYLLIINHLLIYPTQV